jgi:uncharacterized membrane protein YoaK (UPF0700 family)
MHSTRVEGEMRMRLEGFHWTAPAVAFVVGVAIAVLLVLSRSLWKSLPGLVKLVLLVGILTLLILYALGGLRLPF